MLPPPASAAPWGWLTAAPGTETHAGQEDEGPKKWLQRGLSAPLPLPAPLACATFSQQMVLLAHASAEKFCKRINNQGKKIELAESWWCWESTQTQAHTDQGIIVIATSTQKPCNFPFLLSCYCPAFLHQLSKSRIQRDT